MPKAKLAQVPASVIGMSASLARDAYENNAWDFGKIVDNAATGKQEPVLSTFPGHLSKDRLDRLAEHLNEKFAQLGIEQRARVQPKSDDPNSHYLAIPATFGSGQDQMLTQVQRILAETIKASAPQARNASAPVQRANFGSVTG